jgi:hypothetical protein
MKRIFALVVTIVALVLGVPSLAFAGSPHFIQSAFTTSTTGDTLTVSGKEAGLGDEAQIHVFLTATALCINGGGNHPQAVNKESVSADGVFPVQNGKADFTLSVTAAFQPDCAPPMTVKFTDVVVSDPANGLAQSL